MFKKLVSLMVAAIMIASCAVVAASAADTSDVDAAADVISSDAGADTTSETADASNTITFEQPKDWKNVKKMSAHIWMAIDDGSVEWLAWGKKAEQMKDNGDGTWSYDVSKLPGKIEASKGAAYAVIFYADTGMQTYNLIMSADCIGDTAYATGEKVENPEDSQKTAIIAKWKNNTSCGPEKKITSTGNVVGETVPAGASNETLLASYLKAYYADKTKTEKVPDLMKKLGVEGQAVYEELLKLTDDAKILDASKKLLGISEKQAEEAKKNSSTTSNSSNGGSTTSNGNGSNGGSSTSGGSSNSGTNSVSSGQDSTIFFVLGGMMVMAAAVMFVTRRKKD